mmetsp:Transcript_8838/g.22241  ORF Transcript_8838/g.22241 Transcript_8838/m.22241 type:complete len:448 (-) Transcript_8838:70-1413(-)|eukprot:CAMPEP_0177654784 /NCGR_PEP_ID=MMETSP0447-20121125/14543_1 /TAXON_ID=0 /ORGANISM="Stygamoeba regulata, Strain BSH-02190019" /LENGTH=447 /DNA_ID=CAMNT_0019158509 /DNA_START=36 /DNA_END=1379 /DNA_ORIENTATION=+
MSEHSKENPSIIGVGSVEAGASTETLAPAATLTQSIFGEDDSDSEDDLFGGVDAQQLARSAASTHSRVRRLAAGSSAQRGKRKRADASKEKKTSKKQQRKVVETAGVAEEESVDLDTSAGASSSDHDEESEAPRGSASTSGKSTSSQKQQKKQKNKSSARGGEEPEDDDEEEAEESTPAVEKTVWQQTLDSLKSTYRRSREVDPDQAATYVDQLRSYMDEATVADREANRRQQPALARLKLLPMVREALGKKHLLQYYVEHDLLISLRQWLEPLPDGSLPNSAIRLCVLQSLQLMPCESGDLRDSGIGRAVMYVWKSCGQQGSNYAPQHRELAGKLIEKWSRPIFQLSTDYHDTAKLDSPDSPHLSREVRTHATAERSEAEKTRIPRALYMDYAKRPESKLKPEHLPVNNKRLQRPRLKKHMELVAKSGNKTVNRSQRITICKAAPH